MAPAPHLFGDIARAIEAAAARHPALNWHATDPSKLPNRRYVVDHDTSLIYLSTHLESGDFFAAFLDALTELAAGAAPVICSRVDLADVLTFPVPARQPDRTG